MLRPATSDQLTRLVAASSQGSDVQLDAALADLGILPPGDLDEIRATVRPGRELVPMQNSDGHRVVLIRQDGSPVASILPDGTVATIDRALPV